MRSTGRHPLTSFTPLSAVEPESYRDAFLVADLITSRMTFLSGEPKAGKSAFCAGLLRALLEGHDNFIGQEVHRRLESAVYGWTDDGADAELQARLTGTEALERVYLEPMQAASEAQWADLADRLISEQVGMFVLDTVMGALGAEDDISSSMTGRRIIEHARPISEAGIPVLLVTHSPKGNVEGLTVASSVMGSRAMGGGVRGIVALRKNKHGRAIATSINRAKVDLDLRVSLSPQGPDSEVPVWRVLDGDDSAGGRAEAGDWQAELADVVVAEQPEVSSLSRVGDLYAPRVGKTASTVRQRLRGLVEHKDGAWHRLAA